MKILLLNAHSPQNAGDLAILKRAIVCLHSAFPGAELTIAINDDEADFLPLDACYVRSLMRWLTRVDRSGEWHWCKSLAPIYFVGLLGAALLYRLAQVRLLPRSPERRCLLESYYDADVVVVIGGGHLYARHSFSIAFLWLWLGLALAVLMRKPLVFLPQSFGPLPGRSQRWLLRWLLNRSAFIAAREMRSLHLLATSGIKQPVVVMPDMAFDVEEAVPEAVDEILSASDRLGGADRPMIGLTLMDWHGQNPSFQHQQIYEAAVLALVRHVHDWYGADIMIFAQCTGPTAAQDDRRIARRIVATAAAQGIAGPILVDKRLSPELLKGAYGRLDVMIATRMHSAIFALSAGIPTLVIGYLHKSVGIMEMLQLERHVIEIGLIDAETLCAGFDRLWNERDDIRGQLAATVPAIHSTLAHLPSLLQKSLRR